MAFSAGSQGGKGPTTLSEINVTPLVDVMLVLLIIFMITASMENVQAEQDKQLLEEEKQRAYEEAMLKQEKVDQQVPINLPKTNAEQVNITEEQKLVLSLNANYEFYVGKTLVASCHQIAPTLAAELKARAAARDQGPATVPPGFKACLQVVEDKLLENVKLKQDGELYLRADHGLDYGLVLTVMARVRKAGVTKFGLVAEPDLEQ